MTASGWLAVFGLAFAGAPAAAGSFDEGLLHSPAAYREGVKAAYVMDAPYLARMFDASPGAARELSSLRGGRILVTGGVVRVGTLSRSARGMVLESNRTREVHCVFGSASPEPDIVRGSVVSVKGRLSAPGSATSADPVEIVDCEVVWSSQEVRVAAATMLWCAADRVSATSGSFALRRGTELLASVGMKEPPTGCNEGLLLLINECGQGTVRRECTTPWVQSVLALMSPAGPSTNENRSWVAVSLPYGLVVDVPSSWSVNTGARQLSVAEYAASAGGNADVGSGEPRPFIANLFDSSGLLLASANVFFHSDQPLTQAKVAGLGAEDVATIAAAWSGATGITSARRRRIGGLVAFQGEYRMTVAGGEYRNQVVEVFAGRRSFTLTVGYRESAGAALRDRCDRLIESMRFE
jgi:hypothetical protein